MRIYENANCIGFSSVQVLLYLKNQFFYSNVESKLQHINFVYVDLLRVPLVKSEQ